MHFGICNEIFQGWKLEDAMRFAAALEAEAGLEGVGRRLAVGVAALSAATEWMTSGSSSSIF